MNLIRLNQNILFCIFTQRMTRQDVLWRQKTLINFLINLRSLDSIILGISKDSIESHKKFKKKHNIKFDLLSDEEKNLLKPIKHGVKKNLWAENLWVKLEALLLYLGTKIINEWRNVRVKDHAQEILDFIKSFKKIS